MESIKTKFLQKISGDFNLLSEIILKQIVYIREMLNDTRNNELFDEIERNEKLIDGLDVKMRDEVINSIFLFSPKATDLRKIIAYHDMTIYLERIGDQIHNVANFLKRCNFEGEDFVIFRKKLSKMMKYSEEMVQNAVYSFACEDNSRAYRTISTDDKLDELFHEINTKLIEVFSERLLSSQDLLNISSINSISYNIERVGDNATNIAEAAIYLIEGKDIRHLPHSESSE